MTDFPRQCANYYKSIQEQNPLPGFSSRILKCFYGIHAAGTEGSCCFLALFSAPHFICSVSRCKSDTQVLVNSDCCPFLQTGSIFHRKKAFLSGISLMRYVCGDSMVQHASLVLLNTVCVCISKCNCQ